LTSEQALGFTACMDVADPLQEHPDPMQTVGFTIGGDGALIAGDTNQVDTRRPGDLAGEGHCFGVVPDPGSPTGVAQFEDEPGSSAAPMSRRLGNCETGIAVDIPRDLQIRIRL